MTGTASTDQISGGKGDDTINVTSTAASANDIMDGGAGTGDTMVIIADTDFADIDANIINIENITVNAGIDVVLTGQTEGFAITTGTAAGVNIITLAQTGANTVNIADSTETSADIVILDNVVTTLNVISGVDSAEDIIKVGGTLKAGLAGDTAKVEGDVAANTSTGATYAIETAAIGWVDEGDNGTFAVTDFADLTKVAAAVTGAFVFGDAGNDATLNKEVFVVEADTLAKFGVYVWTQSAAGDTTVGADELVYIAEVDSTNLVAADIGIA